MKITKQRLQEIIKEEVERALMKEYTSYSGGQGMGVGVPAYDPHVSPAEEEPMDPSTAIDHLMKARIGLAQHMPEGLDDLDYVIGLLSQMGEEHEGMLPSGMLPGSGFVRR